MKIFKFYFILIAGMNRRLNRRCVEEVPLLQYSISTDRRCVEEVPLLQYSISTDRRCVEEVPLFYSTVFPQIDVALKKYPYYSIVFPQIDVALKKYPYYSTVFPQIDVALKKYPYCSTVFPQTHTSVDAVFCLGQYNDWSNLYKLDERHHSKSNNGRRSAIELVSRVSQCFSVESSSLYNK